MIWITQPNWGQAQAISRGFDWTRSLE